MNSHNIIDPQAYKTINMLNNTHLIKINDSQTTKNKESLNQVIEDEFLNSQLSKRSKLRAHYSSLLNQKEREINR